MQLVPTAWWTGGLAVSTVLCVAVVRMLFGIPSWQVLLSVALSCLVAILAVRALGQTDLNPVSGVGKLSQIVFAVVAPGSMVTNVVAGAVAEAGATQAGDLLQDLKAAHLIGASPRAMFVAQLVGSTWSVFTTVAAYQMYEQAYGVPSDLFRAPVAYVWFDMARIMKQGPSALPPSALHFSAAFAAVGAALPLAERVLPPRFAAWLPSGIAVGVGMYLTPDWVLPRAAGAAVDWMWRRRCPASHQLRALMLASGFILGDGVASIAALLVRLAAR